MLVLLFFVLALSSVPFHTRRNGTAWDLPPWAESLAYTAEASPFQGVSALESPHFTSQPQPSSSSPRSQTSTEGVIPGRRLHSASAPRASRTNPSVLGPQPGKLSFEHLVPIRNNSNPVMSPFEHESLANHLQQPLTSAGCYVVSAQAHLSDLVIWTTVAALIVLLRLVTCGAVHPKLARLPNLSALVFGRVCKPKKQQKFNENLWYACCHTTSFVWNMTILVKESRSLSDPGWPYLLLTTGRSVWYFLTTAAETALFLPGWPFLEITSLAKPYYGCQYAFWMSNVAYLLLETTRTDFKIMVVHHIATLILICGSYLMNFWRVGLVVLVLHDVVDIFLYAAKTIHYTTMSKKVVDALFVMFATSFFVARLVLYPMYVVIPTLDYQFFRGATLGLVKYPWYVPGVGFVLPFLLVLQVLHVFWFALIVRMVYTLLTKETVTEGGDIRSDKESDSESEVERIPADHSSTMVHPHHPHHAHHKEGVKPHVATDGKDTTKDDESDEGYDSDAPPRAEGVRKRTGTARVSEK